MTATTNIKTTTAKILMMAIVLAALVAAMAATAKPVEAATGTTCSNAATAPNYHSEGGKRYIAFTTFVRCSNSIDGAAMETIAYQQIGGVWKPIKSDYYVNHKNSSYYPVTVGIYCGKPYTPYKFKTVQNRTQTKAFNGTIANYPNRYSGIVTLYC